VWRAAHGHTLLNLNRGKHDLPWKRILIDVADKLKPGLGWTAVKLSDATTEFELEQVILGYLDERAKRAWAAMSEVDKQKLVDKLNADLSTSARLTERAATQAGWKGVTMASLGAGIATGLVSGAGALVLAQGVTSAVVGSIVGGTLYRLGMWVIVRLFGFWSGAQLAVGGGAAVIGGALLSAPAAVAFAANAVMSTSYRKSIAATLVVLSAHEMRRQLAAMEEAS
jgi:uncharacterized protein YaaW (UPF0174 family)